MSDVNQWLLRLLPPTIIIATILFNRLWLPQQWRQRRPGETAVMCDGLRTELAALIGLYEENLRMIARAQPPLVSMRMATSFYRTNMPRIIALLDRETLALVVAIFTNNESIESYRSAIALPHRPALRSRPDSLLVAAAEEKLREGAAQIRIAIMALERSSNPELLNAAPPAPKIAPLSEPEWYGTAQ
jgi:hypothetical protein